MDIFSKEEPFASGVSIESAVKTVKNYHLIHICMQLLLNRRAKNIN